MFKLFHKIAIALMIILITSVAQAAVTAWQIVPDKSHITFIATQNNAPVNGEFKKFDGTINFDPNQLDKSDVHVVVDMNSITTSDPDISNTLKTAEWFNVKLFPQATFNANEFTKTGDNTYQAKGTLIIRDKNIPITLKFVLEQYTSSNAVVKGTVILKRNDFGIGQGEWVSTEVVKDDVQVNFQITASKKLMQLSNQPS